MHIKNVLITFFILSNLSLLCQVSDTKKDNLSGNVSSIRTTSVSIPTHGVNIGKRNEIVNKIVNYDTSGFILKISNYKKGTLFSYSVYDYDINNRLKNIHEYNGDNSLYLTIMYTSNEDGTIIIANYDRSLQKMYDTERNVVDVEFAQYYKKLFTKVIYTNDFKGYTTKGSYFTADSILSYKYLYEYDYKYNKTSIKYYNSSGNLSWRKRIKYNTDGNAKEIKLFESNRLALTSKFEYKFDQNNNWIKRTETRKLHDNFFADGLNDNTVITTRDIIYY